VNCVKQNWEGSSFLGRLDQQVLKRTFYDTTGTLLGKLVIPVAFLLYLCALKKFKWAAIKAAAREWALH